ncbi:MAG: amidohydrolase family protein [Acidobacteria bacterium]|nr:amidohydrolase family protein [Acidobacteriota bacterium]
MRKLSVVSLFALLCWTVRGQTAAQDLPPEVLAYADLVLYNGKVITADQKFSVAEAVAVRDGRFLAAGESARILKMAGPKTRRIDLRGRSVLPGLIDTHFHLHQYVTAELTPEVKFETIESGLEEVKNLVSGRPEGAWVILRGSTYGGPVGEVTRQQLDRVSPKNPLAISVMSVEWVLNSKGLEAAQLPPDTPGLVKDPKTGEPTGQLRGWASGIVGFEVLPWQPVEKLIPLLHEGMKRYVAQGMTTVCTRVPGNHMSALRELWMQGKLPMRWRINHQVLWKNPRGEAFLKRMGNLNDLGDDMLKISALALDPADHTLVSGAALTWKPQLRQMPTSIGSYGMERWEDPEKSDRKNVILSALYGWRILGLHSAGDRATSQVLEAYEEANRQRPVAPLRLGIDHSSMILPEHIQKMKQLGVIPSVGPKYVFYGSPDTLVYMYGGDEVHRMSPVKSLIDAGLEPVIEMDNATFSAPLLGIEKFVTREDDKGRVWGERERITRQQGLWMKTLWAARYTGDEKKLGSIEAGKLADLVVVDGDFLTVREDLIGDLPVLLTVVGGKVMHEVKGKL